MGATVEELTEFLLRRRPGLTERTVEKRPEIILEWYKQGGRYSEMLELLTPEEIEYCKEKLKQGKPNS